MASQRMVNTNFWKDSYVIDLDPVQKLLFLYFLTNPRTTLAGIYEISIREIAFDTGIDKDMVEKIIKKFCDDGKLHFEKNWIVLFNFVKHQRLNPSMKVGIERAINELPQWIQEKFDLVNKDEKLQIERTDSTQSGDSLSEGVTPNLIKYNLTKLNITKLNKNKSNAAEPQVSKDFDKKAYAKAVKADKEQAERAKRSTKRSGSTKSVGELFGAK